MKPYFKFVFYLTLVLIANVGYAQQSPGTIMQKTSRVLGIDEFKKPIYHFYYNDAALGREQSDRSYAPFFTTAVSGEAWFNPQINATYVKQNMIRVGSGPFDSPSVIIKAPGKAYAFRDTASIAVRSDYDKLNAWAVVLDWWHDKSIERVADETYRDYPRIILQRETAGRKERLFIDPKTYFPVKLEWDEPHSLWGQRHIEIVYSNWKEQDGTFFAASSFRLEDGEPMVYRTCGKSDFTDDNGLFARFAQLPAKGDKVYDTEWYVSEQPQLVKVSHHTYLLRNRMYTETVTQIGDTIYLLDATLSEERAKQDEVLIKQTFPGAKQMVVVVTDLAWPHIGGVRYWVSKGATIISHRANQRFLGKIVNRKWVLKPDELEQHRKKIKFVTVNAKTTLAGGGLVLFPIDGIGSECALAAFITQDKFLWASDYVQDIKNASAYAQEVIAAVKREDIEPSQMAAEHVPTTEWKQVLSVNRQ